MERLGPAVERELGRFGPEAGIGPVVEAWPAAVGEAIARQAWPARVARDGTLHVAVSSSAWAFELTQLAETVRERLRERLGEAAPSGLRFAVGPLPEPAPPTVTRVESSVSIVTPGARAEGERLAAGIEGERLRKAVARAAAASLSRPPAEAVQPPGLID